VKGWVVVNSSTMIASRITCMLEDQ
jgi:hypothetical protein